MVETSDSLQPDSGSVWDVVVVGAGMAGSFVAERLARDGASVLVLESGVDSLQQEPGAQHLPGRWPAPVQIASEAGGRRKTAAAILGHGPGGSSALYGGALERFRAEDFTGTRAAPPDALPTAWPISHDDLTPWYEEAETRLGVQGGHDPASPPSALSADGMPGLSERDVSLVDVLRTNGHAPYRLPVAIAYKPGCDECQGRRCLRACKGEGWASALSRAAARTVFGAHVSRLTPSSGGRVAITVTRRGQPATIEAGRVVLAAGALNTPRLLLASPDLFASGTPHALIGRGLMFHASDLFCVAAPPTLRTDGPKKTLGLRDFYDLPSGRGGEVQSLGFDMSSALVARYMSEVLAARGIAVGTYGLLALRVPAALYARRFETQAVLATILEDLPYRNNRVAAAPGAPGLESPIEIDYHVAPELQTRWDEARAAIRKAFSPLGVTFLHRGVAPNLGHPCGSVRMGDDAEHCPADANGRLRDTKAHVTIADASLFPSSGGVNPALTVAANALRIAEALSDAT